MNVLQDVLTSYLGSDMREALTTLEVNLRGKCDDPAGVAMAIISSYKPLCTLLGADLHEGADCYIYHHPYLNHAEGRVSSDLIWVRAYIAPMMTLEIKIVPSVCGMRIARLYVYTDDETVALVC